MGFENLVSFINKSINNPNTLDEINYINSNQLIHANHILVDLNFLIYIAIQKTELECNNILNMVLSLSYMEISSNKIRDKIEAIIKKKHWVEFSEIISCLLDGSNKKIIIDKLTNFLITEKNYIQIIFNYIFYQIVEWIEKIHTDNFIKSVYLFIDGIPSTSKIFEQRRRRVKNNFEGIYRRSNFSYYFENISKEIINIDGVNINYMDTLKTRISLSKSIGPSSDILLSMDIFLKDKLKQMYPKCDIIVSNSYEYGEADFKLFKYIDKYNISGDISIHTSDSDLYLQTAIQQVISKIRNLDRRFIVIKHNTKSVGVYQRLHPNNFLINLNKIFFTKFSKNLNNNHFLDILFLFLLFGNDHLPPSIQFGPELGISYILEIYYNSLFKINMNLLTKNNLKYIIDYDSFSILMDELNKDNLKNITKIYFSRNIRLSSNLTKFFFEELGLNIFSLRDFIYKYWVYEGYNLVKKYPKLINYDGDIRFKMYKKWKENNKKRKEPPKDPFSNKNIDSKIRSSLSFMKDEFASKVDPENVDMFGFSLYFNELNINENYYQTIYSILLNHAQHNISDSNKFIIRHYNTYIDKYPEKISDLNLLTKETEIEKYLITLQYLVNKFFGNMEEYNPCDFWYYPYFNLPDLFEVSKFIKENKKSSINYINILEKNKVKKKDYFDYISHQIFITPFLDYNNIEQYIEMTDKKILTITKDIITKIDNITINKLEDFNYKDIDPKNFIKLWTSLLSKIFYSNKKKEQEINKSIKFLE